MGYEGLENSDVETLKSRICKRDDPALPEDSIYIFATNAAVNNLNAKKLSEMHGKLFTAKAIVAHKTLKNYKPFVIPATGCIRNTNLLETLRFKVNCKVFLCYNTNTNDSLVNGSFGRIVGVKENANGDLLEIHVHFLHETTGKETAKKYPDLKQKYGVTTIPVKRLEAQPRIGSQNYGVKSTCTVYMFPLRLAHAVTIHKVRKKKIKVDVYFSCTNFSGSGTNV